MFIKVLRWGRETRVWGEETSTLKIQISNFKGFGDWGGSTTPLLRDFWKRIVVLILGEARRAGVGELEILRENINPGRWIRD